MFERGTHRFPADRTKERLELSFKLDSVEAASAKFQVVLHCPAHDHADLLVKVLENMLPDFFAPVGVVTFHRLSPERCAVI
jgi:hypothetical protein